MPRITSESSAASPGVRSLSSVSSFADSAVSQPQYMKIDSESAVARTEKELTENGLSHETSKSIDVLTSPPRALPNANAVNSASATTWTPTRTYMTLLVVVIPR